MHGYIGLGSNVGRRDENLLAAVQELDRLPRIDVGARSSVYETEPVGEILDQPDFLNAVVAIRTTLSPMDLLAACKEAEERSGRRDDVRHGPRSIDIDILSLGDLGGSFGPDARGRTLVLPHPGVFSRRFVLIPLLELDPGLRLSGRRLADCLDASPAVESVVLRHGLSLFPAERRRVDNSNSPTLQLRCSSQST